MSRSTARHVGQYVAIVAWLVLGAYLGVAAWMGMRTLQATSVRDNPANAGGRQYEYDGLVFRDEQSVREFLQERRSTRVAPWIFELPEELIPLVACLGFGVLGGAAQLMKTAKSTNALLPGRLLFAEPILGGVIGLMVVLLAWAIPALLTTAKVPLRPESVIALALCGGAFSDRAWGWLERLGQTVFPQTGKE